MKMEKLSLPMLGVGEPQGRSKPPKPDPVCQRWRVKGPGWGALLGGKLSSVYLQEQVSWDKKGPMWSIPCFFFGCSFWLLGSRKQGQSALCFPSPKPVD